MKHCFTFLLMAFLFGPVFGQAPASLDYETLMKSNKGLVEDFIQAREELSIISSNYAATIENIFSSEGHKAKGPNSGNAKNQQRQLERMIHVVPVFVSTSESKEGLIQKVDSWVNGFCKEYGLPYEQEKTIRQDLNAYAKAYGKYSDAFNKLQVVVNGGQPIPPAVPPPPPPPQQHH